MRCLKPPLDEPIKSVEELVLVERIGVRIDDDEVEEIGVEGAYLHVETSSTACRCSASLSNCRRSCRCRIFSAIRRRISSGLGMLT